MKTLPFGQCITCSGFEYAVSAITLTEGKVNYTIIGMDNPTLANILETSISAYGQPSKIFTLDEVRNRQVEVQAYIDQCEAEPQAYEEDRRTTTECARQAPEYADLLTVDNASNTTNIATKNIRILLKKNFNGVKFSVRKQDYTCINVSWTDGPTKDAVEAVIGQFQEGSFDGMVDMYEYNTTSFNRVYGGVKYLFCQRSYSDELIAEAIAQLRKERGETAVPLDVSVEDHRKGRLWGKGLEYFHHGLQSAVYGKISELDKTKS